MLSNSLYVLIFLTEDYYHHHVERILHLVFICIQLTSHMVHRFYRDLCIPDGIAIAKYQINSHYPELLIRINA